FAFGPATQMSAPSWGVDSDENAPSEYTPPLTVITFVPSPPSLVTSMLPAPAEVTSAAENFPIWWFVTASIHASNSDPPEFPNVHGFAGTTSRSSGALKPVTTSVTPAPSIATTLSSSSAPAKISPPCGPKPAGATAGPSRYRPVALTSVGVPAVLIRNTEPFTHVTIMSFPNVPTVSNVIPLWIVRVASSH